MTTIAIIGTAGRRDDAVRLDWPTYLLMRAAVLEQLQRIPRPWHGRSGGAAWADHIAVDLYLCGILDELTLYLPCPINQRGEFVDSPTGRIARYYHNVFSRIRAAAGLGTSFDDLAAVMRLGAQVGYVDAEHGEGFHPRNILVGQCEVVIALTFGGGVVPKDGGTRHTWDNSTAPTKIHIPIGKLQHPPPQQNLFSEGP